MKEALRRLLARVPPSVATSCLVHGLTLGALLLVPGVLLGSPGRERPPVVRLEPASREPAAEPLPLEPGRAAEPTEPGAAPLPRLEEPSPAEPPPFADAWSPVANLEILPPLDLARSARPKPPERAPDPPPAESHPVRPPPPVRATAIPSATVTEAVALTRPSPEYPPQAVDLGYEGRVVLLAEVRPDGSVGEITVQASSGHRILDEAARRALQRWIFAPARANGRPVRSTARVPFRFDLSS
jgi:protein TonB